MLTNILITKDKKESMKLFEVTSKIIKQNPKSKSLRTTIPSEIAGIMELTDDDKLVWVVGVENNEPTITLQKLK